MTAWTSHPYRDVAIAAVHNTKQSRFLEGYSSLSLQLEAAIAVIDQAGLDRRQVDGVCSPHAERILYNLGLGPAWTCHDIGIKAVHSAVMSVASGATSTVVIVDGAAGLYTERDATAPWTRPAHEFVMSAGMFTAVEFALVARRHMTLFGTTPQQLALVAATIRNNGHVNPEAVYFGRGPYEPEDILASRMVADPFHLLDCSMTSEGGAAMVVTTADHARDLPNRPVYVLGAGFDALGPAYEMAPSWNLQAFHSDEFPLGVVGRRAARTAFRVAGLTPADVDLCELYDAFSFEVIRQLEAFGFCADGEGGAFVEDGHVGPEGDLPITTDGGLMSFNHSYTAQCLQRVGRAVHQLQGTCSSRQVAGAQVALASNFGAGALCTDVMLLGTNRP